MRDPNRLEDRKVHEIEETGRQRHKGEKEPGTDSTVSAHGGFFTNVLFNIVLCEETRACPDGGSEELSKFPCTYPKSRQYLECCLAWMRAPAQHREFLSLEEP